MFIIDLKSYLKFSGLMCLKIVIGFMYKIIVKRKMMKCITFPYGLAVCFVLKVSYCNILCTLFACGLLESVY